jgi:superfamily II DNA or RNA helicase
LVLNTGDTGETSFPIYRENTAKIYLPRFYGVERYGLPEKCELEEGEDIDIAFVKELRDYQTKIIQVYMDYVNTPVTINDESNGNGAILEVPCGKGKTVMALKNNFSHKENPDISP